MSSAGDITVESVECVANCSGVETDRVRPMGTVFSKDGGTVVNVRLMAGRQIDLAAVGATPSTRFRLTLRIDAEGPFASQTLVASGSDAALISKTSGDLANVTVEVEPASGAINRNIRVRDPSKWPDRDVTATKEADTVGRTSVRNFATPGWRRSSYSYVRQYDAVALVNVAEVGDSEYAELDGVVMATDAQLFTAPSYQPPADGDPPALQLELAVPHFLTDGSTVNSGQFWAFLPASLLERWGVSGPQRLTVTSPRATGRCRLRRPTAAWRSSSPATTTRRGTSRRRRTKARRRPPPRRRLLSRPRRTRSHHRRRRRPHRRRRGRARRG